MKDIFTVYSLELFELTDANGNGAWAVVDNYYSLGEAKASYDKIVDEITAKSYGKSYRLEKRVTDYTNGTVTAEVIAEKRAAEVIEEWKARR